MHKYKEADTSFLVNSRSSLRPIRIALPKPPPLKTIDGYGKAPEDQKFEKIEIPYRLKRLEDIAVEEAEKEAAKRSTVLSQFKISKHYWKYLKDNSDIYQEEIQFIKKMWWHRMHGYWFFNNGKPTYIDGWHFMYLNFWHMSTDNGITTPEYRERNREEFLFYRYSYQTKEYFEELKENGDASSLKMKKAKHNTCLGVIQPKNRRNGNTNMALNIGYEICSRTIGTDGGGIMSYTEKNASDHFDKLMIAWRYFPLFFKPYTVSTTQSSALEFDVPKNEYLERGLKTKIDYATTADAKFYDGLKKVWFLVDESGKTDNVDVEFRWMILKSCITLGGGAKRVGFSFHPSTVRESSKGFNVYRNFAKDSKFYNRVKGTGQTSSGCFELFVPADHGLEDKTDEYGMSELKAARDYIESHHNHLESQNTPDALAKSRDWKREYPLRYEDCWLGDSSSIGWNLKILDKAKEDLDLLTNADKPVKGNFIWKDGIKDNVVEFIRDNEGRWEVSELFSLRANKRTREPYYDPVEQEQKMSWTPDEGWRVTLGVDPYRPNTGRDAKIAKSGYSDGAIVVKWNRDSALDPGDNRSEWQSDKIIATYLNRPLNLDDFCEDVIKAAIWFGGYVFPETNLEEVAVYMRKRGYAGYLNYFTDDVGKMNNKPGIHMNATTKPQVFNHGRDFIQLRGHTLQHRDLLDQLTEITNMDDMTRYDLVAAFLIAEYGSKSKFGLMKRQEIAGGINMEDFRQMLRR